MKLFRWQGLVVFIVLAALTWVGTVLFVDPFIKDTVEDKGSEALQSQIDIGKLVTSFSRQSIAIDDLALANPDNLEENTLEVGSFRFNVDAGKGVYKKLVVDEMAVEGIRFNTKRKTPAKAYRLPEEKSAGETPAETAQKESDPSAGFSFGEGLDIKSPEDILKSEKLETLEAVETTKAELQGLVTKWQERLESELGTQAIEDTKQRIMSLKDKAKKPEGLGDVQAIANEFKEIRNEIQGKLDLLPNLKSELNGDIQRTKKMLAELKDLPRKDFERLKNKYSLDPQGGGNLVGTLLQGPMKQKLDKAWKYYRMISPYLNRGKEAAAEEEKYVRGKGVFVSFAQADRSPDFLVKHAKLSMDLLGTQVAGDLQDLSDNQKLHGKPMLMNFNSTQDDRFDRFSLQVKMDRTQPVSADTVNAEIKSLKLENISAGEGASIQSGLASLNGVVKIEGENKLSGTIQASLSQLSFSLPEREGDEIFNAISQSLSTVKEFVVEVSIDGTLGDYRLDIHSNLNDIIAGAVKGMFTEKIKSFESDLRKSIGSSTQGPLANVNGMLGGLLDNGKVLDAGESSLKGLLKEATGGSSLIPSDKKLDLPGGLKLPF